MRVTETNQEDVRNWIKLRLARNLDTFGAIRLLKVYGSAEAVLEASLTDLARIVGMPAAEGVAAAARGAADDEADAAVDRLLSTPEASVLTIADSLYPAGLIENGTAPLLLFARGNESLLLREAVTICGSVSADEEGLRNAEFFGKAISEAGLTVLVPAEPGIPAAAISGALSAHNGVPPAALLASGTARASREMAGLLKALLAAGGLLISAELPDASQSEASKVLRDGLLAGFSRRLLVIEAERSSPILDIARRAAELGSLVGAVPGSIHNPLSRGANALIREGAMLVETLRDLGIENPAAQK
ncbi:DNA-processing protein DprA [uncultured Sutterella sp.]|uniref:DNA-processing protein DprA n=1 Tax=uncultured Sutterella sp. TaxID=286133 RepID=UPI00261C07C9|nr:DNA-processing protein DprA [uncultured Sutterella sp.]